MPKLLWSILSFVAVVHLPAASCQAQTPGEIAPYLSPQRLVRIAGNRTVNLVCEGQGAPTVILTAGLGGWSQVWYRLQGHLSQTTRTCAWDPAGLGFSSPSPEPQDAVHQTADLEDALKTAQINGPYVLVAHSAGSYVALRFADQLQATVAGMILVDPAVPDETAIRERVAPKFAAFGGGAPSAMVERLRQCAASLQSGALKNGTAEFDQCTAQPLPDGFASLSAQLAKLNADPARLLTQASAIADVGQSGREAINAQRNYGNMPLMVLSSGLHPIPPDMPTEVREQAERYFRTLTVEHRAIAALSTRGQERVISNSGHFIQFDNPAAVLAAIHSVVAESRLQPSERK